MKTFIFGLLLASHAFASIPKNLEALKHRNDPKKLPDPYIYPFTYTDKEDVQLTRQVKRLESLVWLCYNKTKLFLDKEVPQPKELTEA